MRHCATLASANYSLGGIIGNYDVVLNNPATGIYDDKNVGTGKTVTVSGLAISGADAANYQFAATTISGAVGQIGQATVTAGLSGSVTKVYDTTTSATLAAGNCTLSGVLGSDVVTLNSPTSGSYDNKNAGAGKYGHCRRAGAGRGGCGQLPACGHRRQRGSGDDYRRDRDRVADGHGQQAFRRHDCRHAVRNYQLAGVLGGDTVALNHPTSGSYDTSAVGTGKMVTVTAAPGADAGNDQLAATTISGAVGTINPQILLMQSTTAASSTPSVSVTISPTAGDFLVVCVSATSSEHSAPTITPPSEPGPPPVRAAGVGGRDDTAGIYYLWNCSGGSQTFTFTASRSDCSIAVVISEFAGIKSTANPLDVTASNAGTFGNGGSIVALGTTAQANELLIGIWEATLT